MARHEPGAMIGYPELTVDKGLKRGALGLIASIVIGVASTAPAYSLAASLGFVVATQNGDGIVGVKAPSIMLLAFVPMFLIAIAYQQLNSAEPDCGTTFTWATRAFGPRAGWMGGWGIIAADVIVMANLAQIAGSYTFQLLGLDSAAESTFWSTVAGVIWIIIMTYICFRGIEVSARMQYALLGIELVILLAFSVMALLRVYTGNAPEGYAMPSLSWLWPSGLTPGLDGDGHADRGVHLLGLGHGRLSQRGERRPGEDPGTSGDHLHAAAPRDLRAGLDRHSGLRRCRGHRVQPGQRGQLRRRLRSPGSGGLRGQPHRPCVRGPAHRLGPHLGVGLDTDHDPADGADRAVDGRLQGASRAFAQVHPAVPDPLLRHDHDGNRLHRLLRRSSRRSARTSLPTRSPRSA